MKKSLGPDNILAPVEGKVISSSTNSVICVFSGTEAGTLTQSCLALSEFERWLKDKEQYRIFRLLDFQGWQLHPGWSKVQCMYSSVTLGFFI